MSWNQYRDDGFLWFKFNNKYSYDYGIVRTSDGGRFNQDLFPSTQDRTATVPGKDGMYYFDSNYNKREFSIPYAFEKLTEQQLKNLSFWLGDKQIHELIFGERREVFYMAKVTGSSIIKYIPFNGTIEKIYQESSYKEITFEKKVLLQDIEVLTKNKDNDLIENKTNIPAQTEIYCVKDDSINSELQYGYSQFFIISEQLEKNYYFYYGKLDEYVEESSEPDEKTNQNFYNITVMKENLYNGEGKITFTCYYPFARRTFTFNSGTVSINNDGVKEAEYKIKYSPTKSASGPSESRIFINSNQIIKISFPEGVSVPDKVIIDSRTELITGELDGENNIYNQYLSSDSRFEKIPIQNDITLTIENGTEIQGNYDLIYY